MTAATATPATERVGSYVAAHEAFAARAAGPEWLRERRAAAIARFAEVGFPSTHEERWRFTSVEPIATGTFRPPPTTISRAAREAVDRVLLGEPGERIVATFVNGRFQPELSSLEALPRGVTVGSLAEAVKSDGEVVRAHLGRTADPGLSPFTALGLAFAEDGAVVHIGKNVIVDQPIQLVFVSTAGREPVVSHPRALIVLDEGAQVSLMEQYVGAGGVYWVNAATEWVIGDNAVVDAYRIQRDADAAFHTAVTQSRQARNSVFSAAQFVFGGALSRHDIGAELAGEGAECTLNGLSMLRGEQVVDHHTTIDHAKPHCNSWELFNGVYDDRARGVFTGRIVVEPGAQKTDSKQTSNSLLLSKEARSDSQPQLEIYADDVKCTHGATLGPIDERSMFYLRSRGIGPEDARNLLTYGFGAEILNSVSLESLRLHLDRLVQSYLEARAGR